MSPPRARVLRGSNDADPAGALRAHLVAVTAGLLADRGVSGLTARVIARSAGVSDGVLYNHFRDKNDLVLAALRSHLAALVEAFDATQPEAGTHAVRENLRALMAASVTAQTHLLRMTAGLIAQSNLLRRFSAEIHAEGIDGPAHVIGAVERYLHDEQHLGRLNPAADAHIAAVLLFGAGQLQALAMQFRPPDNPNATADEFDPVIDFVMMALAPEAKAPPRTIRSIPNTEGEVMPPTIANGKICYLEIPTDHIEHSSEFYRAVFDWNIRRRDDGTLAFDDTVNEVSGTWVTGRPASTEPGILIYVMVDNVEQTLEKVRAAGGDVVTPPEPQGPGEAIATFRDPAGNVMGIGQQP